MGYRDENISRSIVSAILRDDNDNKNRADTKLQLWKPLRAFFAIYGFVLTTVQPELFRKLRNKTWGISEDAYKASFEGKDSLTSKGDMGYSGSVCSTQKSHKRRSLPCRPSVNPLFFSPIDLFHHQRRQISDQIRSASIRAHVLPR